MAWFAVDVTCSFPSALQEHLRHELAAEAKEWTRFGMQKGFNVGP